MAKASDERAERAELLATALGDFRIFCRSLVAISDKDGVRCNLHWNAVQKKYCENRTWRDVILKARQQGFSTLELARDVWKFLQPGQRVLVICQTDAKDSYVTKFSDDINRMFDGLRRAGVALNFDVDKVGSWSLPGRDSFLQIIAAGASEAAANKKGRGGTFTRLHSTEASFYEFPEAALNAALEGVANRPNTEIVFESTPKGAGTWFHNFWLGASSGQSSYAPHFFPWYDQLEYRTALNPGETITPQTDREEELVKVYKVLPDQLKWWRAKVINKGRPLVEQEYPTDQLTCFLVSGRQYFDIEATDRLVASIREPVEYDLGKNLRIFTKPVAGRAYLIAADPSEGTGGDPGAAIVYDRQSGEHVATLHGQFPTWEMGEVLAKIGARYNMATIAVERNNHGHAVLQSLSMGQKYPRIYCAPDGKAGWLTNEVSRASALEAFEAVHRTGKWKTPDSRVLSEMRTFIINKSGKAEAAQGSHDDLVMASVIGWDVLRKPFAPPRRHISDDFIA